MFILYKYINGPSSQRICVSNQSSQAKKNSGILQQMVNREEQIRDLIE